MFNFSTTKNENEYHLGGNLAAHMLQSPHAAVAELVDALALGANRLACLFLYFIGGNIASFRLLYRL